MAFNPTDGSGDSTSSDTGTGIGIGAGAAAGIGAFFGSEKQNTEAVKSSESFLAAAKAGKFGVDPDKAKSAIKDLERAEDHARRALRHAQLVAQPMPIGGSPFARTTAKQAYLEGGESALRSAEADVMVFRNFREGVEAAMKNYRRMDDDAAGSFGGGV